MAYAIVASLCCLTLSLLAYVATVFVVHISWIEVFKNILLPQWSWKPAFITTIVAVFGTTISPYLFFWQASQEVEELNASPIEQPLKQAPKQSEHQFKRIKIDTCIGMGFSNMVAFFIMLSTAVTLHSHGITNIETSAQAASALRPIAGDFAFWLFSIGIIGTGLLAIPVLAGAAAYAMAGTFKWKSSLEYKPSMAKKFYAIITLSTLIGVGLCFTAINPIKALYWSAVINGVISIPIMIIMMLMVVRSDVMGEFVISSRLKIAGWICVGVMIFAVAMMFWTSARNYFL
ncbi:MAG: divalent metal cation transporter [Pseudomonadota bacterium]